LPQKSDPRGERRAQLVRLLQRHKAHAIAITHLPNVRYLCGFTGSNAVLLVSARECVLYTDPRYAIQAEQECDVPVRVARGAIWQEAAKEIRRRRLFRLALEADKVSHADWDAIGAHIGAKAKLQPVQGMVEALRAVKSPDEIEKIRRSVLLNSRALELTLPLLKIGMTELEVAAELDYRMRRLGAEGAAFETIVACGRRSALPHARPTSERLKSNRILLIDMGASLQGYASDMTRVFHLGKPGRKVKALYHMVLESQLAAIAAVRPGATCAEVDSAARETLRRHNHDQFFTHSTGHGLGLEIHEGPRLGAKVESPLLPGMVITIEPGVYLEGFGGIRIEDTVLVTETGVEVLTPSAKEFLEISS
jgi:Xaa-Pro aminopeptidase